ncbi:tapasin-related protein isoform X2 [Ascaphus truei]|uniref:tapasin-related protein isoform X2 n=1 Tax=Ascaphus truei TaxID=8439 RepID=UPI003F5A2EE0
MGDRSLLRVALCLTLHTSWMLSAATSGVPRAVDIVLPCMHVLMEDAGGRGGLGGMSFSREEVTLLIRNVTVTGEGGELDPITDYQPSKDTKTTIFQATVTSSPLPFADRLLHADCEGLDISCELSPLSPSGLLYITHIRLPEFSITMVTRTEPTNGMEEDPIGQDHLLSDKSIISMTVDLCLSSSTPSQLTPLSLDVSLNCELSGDPEGVQAEWHLQKEGKGERLFPEEGSRVTMEPGALSGRGDASLTIRAVRVQDEGTYICAVTLGEHRVHQILQLQVREPPRVTIIQTEGPELTLTCSSDCYYPLDVEFSWLLRGEQITHADPVTSSHRRNSDGTYNLSIHLRVPTPPTGALPDTYTCTVSHASLPEPITVTTSVPLPEVSSGALGYIISSLIVLITTAFMFRSRDGIL